LDRRSFLGGAAMTIAAGHLGIGCTEAAGREPRQLTAFGRATEWLNSPRLSSEQLLGKVVLVDFWTYTCINWLRTLPYLRAWSEKYKQGLVVIGVHTPEFPFEHDLDNVRRAVRQMHVDYAVAVDNDYAIWRAFDNQYWPALYVLDPRGRVRHQHFGEGEYEQSEKMIQRLLAEAGAAATDSAFVRVAPAGIEAQADWGNLKSPENYLGYQRTERFASPGGVDRDRSHRYATPARLALNQWGLAGDWTVSGQAIRSNAPGARLVNRFHARDLHLVMGPPRRDSPVRFRVSIDGRPPGPAHGVDVDEGGSGVLAEQRLYQLIRQPGPIADRQFEVEFLDAGAEAFAFTFG
jgi:thiol-disulfide isomerase/thioredoxin